MTGLVHSYREKHKSDKFRKFSFAIYSACGKQLGSTTKATYFVLHLLCTLGRKAMKNYNILKTLRQKLNLNLKL